MLNSHTKVVLLIFLMAFIWFINIDYRKLVHPDEGRYAEIPREMVATGDWLTPRLNDLKYFEKPPLQYWATATAYKLFGEHDATARLWTALTGFLGVLLVWFAGWKLYNPQAGLFAALALLANPYYVAAGHINSLDMGLTFFMTLTLIAYLFSRQTNNGYEKRKWMLIAWAAMALAVMSKGLIGVVLPFVVLIAYSIIYRDKSAWQKMYWVGGICVFLLITAPWFIAVSLANPEFFNFFFIHEHFSRFLTKVHRRDEPIWYFLPILLFAVFPLFLIVIKATREFSSKKYRSQNKFNIEYFLILWIVVIFGFFSVSQSKLPSYILPIMPALALLMGRYLSSLELSKIKIPLIVAGVFAVLVYFIVYGLAHLSYQNESNSLLYQNFGHWIKSGIFLFAVAIVISCYLFLRQQPIAAFVVYALGHFVGMQLMITGFEELSPIKSAYSFAEKIRLDAKKDIPVYSVGEYDQTFTYYLKRPVTLVAFRDELTLGLEAEPQKGIAEIAEFVIRWQRPQQAFAVMSEKMYQKLRAENLPMHVIAENDQHVLIKRR